MTVNSKHVLLFLIISLTTFCGYVSALCVTPKVASNTIMTPSMMFRRTFLASTAVLVTSQLLSPAAAQAVVPPGFKRIRTQFIAALGDPKASSGTDGANDWGLWTVDPGPRGVYLKDYDFIQKNNYRGPDGWLFEKDDWWVEEHGLIMPPPNFPLPAGRYVVTGGREVTTVLTVNEAGSWKLNDGSLYDVTHLPCRSARYKPNSGNGSPLTAKESDFPVRPGAEMPKVNGCDKQDYAVLFVVGVDEGNVLQDL